MFTGQKTRIFKKMVAVTIFGLVCSNLIFAQAVQTIYSSGTVYLPDVCPQGCVAVLTVNVVWKDFPASQGGTGRKIVEEAVFTGREGEREIKFTGVRITPSFFRGEISLNVQCEIKKGDMVVARFKMDGEDANSPKPMSYNEAVAGNLLNLKLKMKAAE